MGVLVRRDDGSTYWDEDRKDPNDSGGSIVADIPGGGAPAPGGGGGGGGGGAPMPGSLATGPGSYSTINGQRSLDQITAELNAAGYNGPRDTSSLTSAYARTAGGSVTYAGAPAPAGVTTGAPPPGSAAVSGFGAPAPGGAVAFDGRDAQGSDGALYSQQSPETRAAFEAIYGPNAAQFWMNEHQRNVRPQAESKPHQQTGAPQPGPQPGAAPAAQGQQAPGANGTRQIVTDSGVYTVTNDVAAAWDAQLAAVAKAAKEAADREYGLKQDQLKLSQAIADGDAAYKAALLAGQDKDRAQQASIQAMEQSYKNQLLELQRQQMANQVSIERERLAVSRQQAGRRRGASVRYR